MIHAASGEEIVRTASFSRDRRYRYTLGRRWGRGPSLTWVMLNPSTADHQRDDPTIRRCIAFSRAWGFDGLVVVNLFALRSPQPAVLLDAEDALGPMGGRVLRRVLRESAPGSVVAAWGNVEPRLARRAEEVRAILPADALCLGLTDRGQPRHPLYVPGGRQPVVLASTLSVFRGPPTMAA